ncbi:MAG: peptidyl-alpha-hydroxyglycine alpha-amidating lyase family protein [Alphaproteobacteria bacterium]
MSVVIGSGDYRYRVDTEWGKLPDGWSFTDVAAVAVDHKDNVYVFNRGEHPMIVFDREGNFLRSWGEDIFSKAHGLHIGPNETLYCTDDGDHTMRACTLDGKVLMTIGTSNKPAPYMSGLPFHRCTHTALSPDGDIYVSDGYGNPRVHKYSPDGRLLFSWGESGVEPGQFNLPHNICCDADGWVYVADRENHRIQVFDGNGKFETQWHNMHRPSGLCMETCSDPLCYVGEIGPGMQVNIEAPNLGPRVTVMTNKGEVLARVGDIRAGREPHQFISPHGLAVDSHGDLYVGEVAFTAWPRFPFAMGNPPPADLRSMRKLVRVRD